MSRTVPIGKREGQKLEFKRAEALKDRRSLPRSVVAMLNAEGGKIWVGVSEIDGRAAEIQDIERPEEALRDLRNRLIDSIEPSPGHGEVRLAHHEEDAKHLILIEVSPLEQNRPYAALWESGRFFHVRVGDRLRFLTREELGRHFQDHGSKVDVAVRQVVEARDEARARNGLWLTIVPTSPLGIQWDTKRAERLLDPVVTGNRRGGWSFTGSFTTVERLQNGVQILRPGHQVRTRLHDGGILEFEASLETLEYTGPDRYEGHDLHPYALVEYPMSVFRLYGTILREKDTTPVAFVSSLALFGICGAILRPYSPRAGHFFMQHRTFRGGEDLLVDPPLVFEHDELVNTPDLCAWRLLRKVYATFGYEEEEMPRGFDLETGRFRID